MTDMHPEHQPATFPLRELRGKRVTDIFSTWKYNEEYALYFGGCIVVLDNHLTIEMPNNFSDEASVTVVPEGAVSEFEDLSDFPVYDLNKLRELRITEPGFNEIIDRHFSEKIPLPEKFRDVVSYHERVVKYLQNRIITDFIRFTDGEPDEAFFVLDNGRLFGQITCTQPGTGYPGPIVFGSMAELEKRYGKEYERLV
jgi:hypothetical protein